MVKGKLIDIHTHKRRESGISVYNLYPQHTAEDIPVGFYSIGIHPWHIDESWDEKMLIAEELAGEKNCLAIGETGLDKIRGADFGLQKIVFEKHIEIASAKGKPLILHCVRAYDDLIRLKKRNSAGILWIIHGFNGKPSVADQLIQAGFNFSFGKALIQADSNARQALQIVKENVFFLETDDSDVPIEEIYRVAAGQLAISVEELAAVMGHNFETLFLKQV